jgi:large subunit ribosomal protein L15
MKLNDLKPASGSKKNRRRVGRGLGSGRGKTAGRGQKGQSSRSGFSQGAGWEGGRSRLIMRLPKRGFVHHNTDYQLVNLGDLSVFTAGATVDAESLRAHGLVRHLDRPIKLLGNGELTVQGLTVEVDAYSRSAVQALQRAGGTVRGDQNAADDAADSATAPAPEAAPKSTTQAEEPN